MATKKLSKNYGKKKEVLFKPSSFFKVMVGEFREFLLIPPKFATVLDGLVDQNVYLKDSSSDSWRVEVSKVYGSLAFCQGWSEFVMHHLIDVGEFIIFNYVGESQFAVHVFGINYCERYNSIKQKINSKRKISEVDVLRKRTELQKRFKRFEQLKETLCCVNENMENEVIDESNELSQDGASKINIVDMELTDANKFTNHQSFGSPASSIESEMIYFGFDSNRYQKLPVDKENLLNHGDISAADTGQVAENAKFRTVDQLNVYEDTYWNEKSFWIAEELGFKFLLTVNGICHVVDNGQLDVRTKFKPTDQLIEYEDVYWNEKSFWIANELGFRYLLTVDGICHIVDYSQEAESANKPINQLIEYEEMHGNNESFWISNEVDFGYLQPVDGIESTKFNPIIQLIENDDVYENARSVWIASALGFRFLLTVDGICLIVDEFLDEPENRELSLVEVFPCENVTLPDFIIEECQIQVMPDYNVQPLQVSDPGMICFSDLSSPNYVDFSVVFSSRPWLKLPGGLPCNLVTNKPGSQDITLRDPLMRLWPVHYIENSRFTGFSAGWKNFARANNLQHGTLCEFSEVADQPRRTFQVQISNVQVPES